MLHGCPAKLLLHAPSATVLYKKLQHQGCVLSLLNSSSDHVKGPASTPQFEHEFIKKEPNIDSPMA